MPLSRRNEGEPNSEPVLSKQENLVREETTPSLSDETSSADVIITPPAIVIDSKEQS